MFPVDEVVFNVESDQKEQPPKSYAFSKRWINFINAIRRPLSTFLLAITRHAATNPYVYIIGTIYLSISLMAWGLFTSFQMEVDSEALYSIKGSRIGLHKQWINQESGFGQYKYREFFLMIHADGENVLGDEGIRRSFMALDTVVQTPGYEQVCMNKTVIDNNSENNSECEIRSVTNFWNGDIEQYNADFTLDEGILEALAANNYPDGTKVDIPEIFGNYEMKNGRVVSSEAFIVTLALQTSKSAIDFEGRALDNLLQLQERWERENIGGNNSTKFRVEFMAKRSLDDESTRAIMKDMPLIPFVFIIMSLFTCFAFWRYHKIKSRTRRVRGSFQRTAGHHEWLRVSVQHW